MNLYIALFSILPFSLAESREFSIHSPGTFMTEVPTSLGKAFPFSGFWLKEFSLWTHCFCFRQRIIHMGKFKMWLKCIYVAICCYWMHFTKQSSSCWSAHSFYCYPLSFLSSSECKQAYRNDISDEPKFQCILLHQVCSLKCACMCSVCDVQLNAPWIAGGVYQEFQVLFLISTP